MKDEERAMIAVDFDVLHGQARIQGTRTPVCLVLGCLADGMNEQEILEQYPSLTVQGIRAAAAYAAELASEQMRSTPFLHPQVLRWPQFSAAVDTRSSCC